MERNEVNQDSINSVNAWKNHKAGYMDRTNKTPEGKAKRTPVRGVK